MPSRRATATGVPSKPSRSVKTVPSPTNAKASGAVSPKANGAASSIDRRREQVVDPYLLGLGVDRAEIEDEAPELRIDRDVGRRERHGAAARAGRIAEIGQVPDPDRELRTERRIGDAQSLDPDREARRRGAELQLTPGQFRTGERGAIEAVHQLEHYARLAVGQRERPVVEAEAPALAPRWQRIRR